MQFGCFVSLEGVRKRSDGLVHISQVWCNFWYMSIVVRKQAFCMCKIKDPDQFCGSWQADQHLYFRSRILKSLYFLNPKFQASTSLLWLYSPVCVGHVKNPKDLFSRVTAHVTMEEVRLTFDDNDTRL